MNSLVKFSDVSFSKKPKNVTLWTRNLHKVPRGWLLLGTVPIERNSWSRQGLNPSRRASFPRQPWSTRWFLTQIFPSMNFTKILWLTKIFSNVILFSISIIFLLGIIEPRAVHPLPNTKHVSLLPCLLPCFCFSWISSLGSSMIVAVFLFYSYRAVSAGKSSSARLSSILRSCPYHLNCLLWILSKMDCSACILLL